MQAHVRRYAFCAASHQSHEFMSHMSFFAEYECILFQLAIYIGNDTVTAQVMNSRKIVLRTIQINGNVLNENKVFVIPEHSFDLKKNFKKTNDIFVHMSPRAAPIGVVRKFDICHEMGTRVTSIHESMQFEYVIIWAK